MAARSKGRRLDVGARRQELLRLGLELFSARAYDEIGIEEIAEHAGISRGLLYHYFPTKRDYYVAVTREAVAEVARLTQPPGHLSGLDSIAAGVDAFLRYADAHPHGFITAYRGALAGDPEVRAMVEAGRRRQAARILALLGGGRDAASGHAAPLVRLAVTGWLAMTQSVTAEWLQRKRSLSRSRLRDWLVATLRESLREAGQGTHGTGHAGSSELLDADA